MSELKFDVVLLGQCQQGMNPDDVINKLAALFRTDVDKVEKMMVKSRHVIKKNVDGATAKKYKTAIEQAGGVCEVVKSAAAPVKKEPPIRAAQPAPKPSAPKPAAAQKTATNAAVNNAYRAPVAPVVRDQIVYCRQCGAHISATLTECPHCHAKQSPTSAKSKVTAGLLAFFLGGLGVHRFYLGQWWGIFYLLFWFTMIPSVVSLIEAIVFFASSEDKWQEKYGQVRGGGGLMVVAAIGGLFVLVAFTGILAAIAIPAYQDYVTRSQVQTSMPFVKENQDKVSAFIQRTGFYPNQNLDAGLPEDLRDKVASIQLQQNARMVVTYDIKSLRENNTIDWTPAEKNGQIEWSCMEGSMPDQYRPAVCRGGSHSSSGDQRVSAASAKLDNVLRSADGRLSLSVPGRWKKMDDLNEEASLGAGNLFDDAYALILEESRADFEDGYTLTDYSELIVSLMQESLVNHRTLGEWRPLVVNGLPARQVALTGSVDGVKVTYLITTVMGEENFYQVLGWTLASRYDNKSEQLQAVAASFKERQNSGPVAK
ncbi:NINE protein [Hahella aquimaris]|uniref:NINE protein n=1 Tax=Hahella sp. HNIBRBA332 TaxID=3015983 RepID=UPI00273A90AA|nr:NINE protein [Hahella sp. HNIBRBA332]WLQ13362.1 NINE protein [Hahella sp. HNIBRBA332]